MEKINGFRVTVHAQARIEQRGIELKYIKLALAETPRIQIRRKKDEKAVIYQYQNKKLGIKVIVVCDLNNNTIITVYKFKLGYVQTKKRTGIKRESRNYYARSKNAKLDLSLSAKKYKLRKQQLKEGGEI